MFEVIYFLLAIVVSFGATGFVRAYALRANLMDVPTERSSHQEAKPRGGGLGIVLVFLTAILLQYITGQVPVSVFIAIFGGGCLVAGIGFADDHGHIPASLRAMVHFFAATIALWALGGLPPIAVGASYVDLGLIGDLLSVVFLVWLVNLFNFMDGIDGIASAEIACIAGGALLISGATSTSYVDTSLIVICAASLGFLVWNWPPAKIFMGDVGSGFIGFIIGALAIESVRLGTLSLWSWLILSGLFVVDATVTLAVRIGRGESWYSAHRSHAYQIAARLFHGHRPVTLGSILINVVWLLPIAWCAAVWQGSGWWLTLLAWSPIVAVAVFLGAGRAKDC